MKKPSRSNQGTHESLVLTSIVSYRKSILMYVVWIKNNDWYQDEKDNYVVLNGSLKRSPFYVTGSINWYRYDKEIQMKMLISFALKVQNKTDKRAWLVQDIAGLMLKPLVIESYIVTKRALGVSNGYPIVQIWSLLKMYGTI